LAERAPGRPGPLSGRRLLLLTAAATLAPAIGFLQWARHASVETPFVTGFSALLFILVLARMSGLVQTLQTGFLREKTLRRSAAALVGASDRIAIGTIAIDAARALAGPASNIRLAAATGDGLRVVAGARANQPGV